MDDFTRIQTFIKVVDAGSFSAAARHESSTSSVARQVKSLEDDLGVRLLNRTTRSLSLTEAGREFYERCCLLSRDMNNAKMAARSYQENIKGLLRVSLRLSAANAILRALPDFLGRHPELSIDVTLSDERFDLVANNTDVAVWLGDIPDSDMVARRLTPARRILCASPQYLARHGVPQKPGDLRQHNCILFNARSHGRNWTFSKDGEEQMIEVQGNVKSANGVALLFAAESGLGLVVLNEWMVRGPIADGRLVRVLGEYKVAPTSADAELYVVYPSSRGLSRKVRVFVDFLVQLFGENEAWKSSGAIADSAEPDESE